MAVSSKGLLAVTDEEKKCVHLLTKEGAFVRSIGKGLLGNGWLFGVAFDVKGNVLVIDSDSNNVVKLSQDDRILQTICHADSESKGFINPHGLSVSPEGLIYICDYVNHCVVVHDEAGKFLFDFGSEGSYPECFHSPRDVAFGSDDLLYVTDVGNRRVCVWSKEGSFKRDFEPKYPPTCIAATSDNHLLIISPSFHTAMVYTLEGEFVHEFGGCGSDKGSFNDPLGICVDASDVVYIADFLNNRVQVF